MIHPSSLDAVAVVTVVCNACSVVPDCQKTEHALVEYNFPSMQRCQLCDRFLCGLVRQGLQCTGEWGVSGGQQGSAGVSDSALGVFCVII